MEEKIKKLPKWVQNNIKSLERERESAINKLNEYIDNQTPSSVFYEDLVCTGEQQGPSNKRKYIQSHRIEFEHDGVYCAVTLRKGYVQINWSGGERWGSRDVAMIPESYQSIRIVSKEKMR